MNDLQKQFDEIIKNWLWEYQGEDYLSQVEELTAKLLWVVAQSENEG